MSTTSTRMQVTLERDQHHRAAEKAARLGLSIAEYIRRLVAANADFRAACSTLVEHADGAGS